MCAYIIKGYISTPEDEFQAPYLLEVRESVFTGENYSVIYVNDPSIDPEALRPIIAEQLKHASGFEVVDKNKIEGQGHMLGGGDSFFIKVDGMTFVSNPKVCTPATVESLYERNKDAIEGRKKCLGPKETVALLMGISTQPVSAHENVAVAGAVADQRIPQKQ